MLYFMNVQVTYLLITLAGVTVFPNINFREGINGYFF